MLTLGKLFGIEIRLHYSVAFLFLFAGFAYGIWAIPIMVLPLLCVLFHEYGHALVARRLYDIGCSKIILWGLGGAALMEVEDIEDYKAETVIALAGPAASMLLAGLLCWLYFFTGWIGFYLLAALNATLGIFNLVPAFPMDGGRVLRAQLSKRLGFYRGSALATKISYLIAGAGAMLGLVYHQYFITLIAIAIAYMNWRESKIRNYY